MDFTLILEKTILVVMVFAITLMVALYETLAERRIAGFFQDRLGPNRAGFQGLLQPLADGVKMFFKEEIIPSQASSFLFIAGPSLAMLTACMTSAVIPWSSDLHLGDRILPLQIADINIGVLYIFGVVSLGVYGVMIGGWASNNKFSLLGAVRAASQNISYEIAMGLSVIALLMGTGTLSLRTIVAQQGGNLFHWNFFHQPLGFLIFLVCAFAETNRTPFDLPECETELVGGYHTEYSSLKLGFYLFAEYINMFISSAVMATLFFGGYHFPGLDRLGLSPNAMALTGLFVIGLKTAFFIFFFMWIRWTIPRFRYDQLMRLGWKILIPLAMFNIVVTGFWLTYTHF